MEGKLKNKGRGKIVRQKQLDSYNDAKHNLKNLSSMSYNM